MVLSNEEIARHVKESLKLVQIGKGPGEIQNAKDFYKL